LRNTKKQEKEKYRLDGAKRGRQAASLDAAGSAMGSIGLLVFALIVWQLAPDHYAPLTLTGATLAWLAVSVLIWRIRKLT